MRRGMTAMAGGDHEEALRSFDRMVAKAPDFAEAWNKRATVLFLMGRYEDSVLDIQRTLQLEPRHFGALSGLGLIYDAVEEPAAAIRSLEAALEINPHLHGTREHIATLQEKLQGDET
jgi:tetratricopeptide (TPR) repeat protein